MLLKRPVVGDEAPVGFSVREATRGDAGPLREMLARCSVDTIYERFHSPYPVVPGWMADVMVGVEPDDGGAIVMLAGDGIVGHAMYVRLDDREAEVAVVVEDAWQSRGVGAGLLVEAARRARRRGVEAFVCETLAGNRRVPALAAAVFSEVGRRVEGPAATIRVPLRSLKAERVVR